MITGHWSSVWATIAPAVENHLWQSTLFAGAAGLLALAMRRNQARVRYGLWLAASIKFLVPYSLLVRAASHLAWPIAAQARASQISLIVQQAGQPFTVQSGVDPVAASTAGAATGILFPGLALAVWLCGFLGILFFWSVRWRRVRAAVCASTPLRGTSEAEALRRVQQRMRICQRVELMETTTAMEPGIFGFVRPMLLLPANLASRLGREHFEAVLAHELCHVRRRDNLASAIHMLVEAVFWFHPLVWWMGARLVEERERACDEEVLKLGNDREVYAESILKTCQHYLESPLACMSGISGSDLKVRIVRIMTADIAKKLSRGRRLLLAVAGLAAVSGPIVLGILNAPPSRAQEAVAAGTPAPKFEVASIKPSNESGGLFRVGLDPSGRFIANNITVKFLLEQAFGMKDSQISGVPGWVDSEHYDIQAKAEDSFAQQKLSRDERFRQVTLMMQSLLADRFKLVVRHETKELPVYALTVAKGGSKLHEAAPGPSEPDSPPPPPPPGGPRGPGGPPGRGGIRMMPGEFNANAVGMDRLADILARIVGRVVVNETGLTGQYDFTLKWTPEQGEGPMMRGPVGPPPADAPPPPDPNGPTIFSALQEQLGLKLESQKSPIDTIVIEHVERPSEN